MSKIQGGPQETFVSGLITTYRSGSKNNSK